MFSVISTNVAVCHIEKNTRFFDLHFYRRQYDSSFNQFDAVTCKANAFDFEIIIIIIIIIKSERHDNIIV